MRLALLVTLIISGCATRHSPVVVPKITESNSEMGFTNNAFKKVETILLDHKYFKITYDPKRRLARYVVYQLTEGQLRNKAAGRKNKFIVDPILKKKGIPLVIPKEYVHSGYDRGHMAPSADFAWSQEANDLTFVMSNMTPQTPNLNEDAWKRLEEKVRKWACGEKKITVITGPILKSGLEKLKSGLEIPEDFYKVVIDETPPKKLISFIYHQTDRGDVMANRIVPISKIEEMTGITLKEVLPEIKNEEIKKTSAISEWKEADCVAKK